MNRIPDESDPWSGLPIDEWTRSNGKKARGPSIRVSVENTASQAKFGTEGSTLNFKERGKNELFKLAWFAVKLLLAIGLTLAALAFVLPLGDVKKLVKAGIDAAQAYVDERVQSAKDQQQQIEAAEAQVDAMSDDQVKAETGLPPDAPKDLVDAKRSDLKKERVKDVLKQGGIGAAGSSAAKAIGKDVISDDQGSTVSPKTMEGQAQFAPETSEPNVVSNDPTSTEVGDTQNVPPGGDGNSVSSPAVAARPASEIGQLLASMTPEQQEQALRDLLQSRSSSNEFGTQPTLKESGGTSPSAVNPSPSGGGGQQTAGSTSTGKTSNGGQPGALEQQLQQAAQQALQGERDNSQDERIASNTSGLGGLLMETPIGLAPVADPPRQVASPSAP